MLFRAQFVLLILYFAAFPPLSFAATKTVRMNQLKETSVKYKGKKERVFCLSLTPGSIRKQGSSIRFTPFADTLKRTNSRKDPKGYAKYKALVSLGKTECKRISRATPRPTPTPTGNFDVYGDVTEAGRILFGIPAGLPANVSQGRLVQDSTCTGCHAERTNWTFPNVRSRIALAPMYIDSNELPDTELAHLIAYLNRFRP